MAAIAATADVGVLGIDYRLAPEHHCPAAIEDALAAYLWLLERGHAPERIAIAGDSAGGGLAVATIVAARDRAHPLPGCCVLLSPWVDLTLGGSVQADQGFDYLYPESCREWVTPRYYRGELGQSDPRVSPLFADLRGLPPLLILAGEAEVLADDSRRFASRAVEAGVEVHLHLEPDEVHVYPAFWELNPRAQAALGRIAGFLDATLGPRRA
jgi:acetyl esterase/lipase